MSHESLPLRDGPRAPGGFRRAFLPKATLSREEVRRGLRLLTMEGTASMGFGSITTSGFLAAFALMLGADNLEIGVLAALPFATMPVQLGTVSLVEHTGYRKLISTSLWFAAQLLWIPVALIPLFAPVPGDRAVVVLLALIAARSVFAAMQSAAWNSWLRDLVPQKMLGSFFARRLMFANVAAMVFGLGAAVFVDHWKTSTTGSTQALGYTYAILAGVLLLGLASPVLRSLIPEPLQEPPNRGQQSMWSALSEPVRDSAFRPLVQFLFTWKLVLNLATPFFAVYMLEGLGLSLTLVMALTVLSTAFNALFLRVWGPLADRFGNKPILSLSASLYLVVILGWVFAGVLGSFTATLAWLAVLQILAGVATAGVSFTTSTFGMKLAPGGKATAYLASASVAINLGAAFGPLFGGQFVDFMTSHPSFLDLPALSVGGLQVAPAMTLNGFAVLFAGTFVLGVLTLRSLSRLKETGELGRERALDALFAPMARLTRPMSTVPGLGYLAQFPYAYIRRVPGIDVAAGVTAYEIAEVARVAALAASQGQRSTGRLVVTVDELLRATSHAWTDAERAAFVARHAARGVVHAAAGDAGRAAWLARSVVHAAVGALGVHPDVDTRRVIRASVSGVMRGALESGEDPLAVVESAIRAASIAGQAHGIPPAEARILGISGALQVVSHLPEEQAAPLRAALLRMEDSRADARHS